MESRLVVILSVGAVALLLSVISTIVLYKAKRKYEPDYRTMFVLGVLWVLFGLVKRNSLFIVVGIPFLLWGIINKGKWSRISQEWKHKLTPSEKNIVYAQVAVVVVLLLLGLALFLIGR